MKVNKPWGYYETYHVNEPCTVKILQINPSEELSYQSHFNRDEKWIVLKGVGTLILDDKESYVEKGTEVLIPRITKHKIINVGKRPLIILEISTGYFDEKDIIRYKDKYNRC